MHLKRYPTFFVLCFLVFMLGACSQTSTPPTHRLDPFEGFNRKVFHFNQQIDQGIYQPVAGVYRTVIPWPFRHMVTNFFHNVNEVPTIANSLLQVNLRDTARATFRLVVNSTLGIFGLIDVAEKMGVERRRQTFGLTLARWGWKESSYLMIPFRGPSTFRDGIGIPADYYMSIYPHIEWRYRYGMLGLYWVNLRSDLLGIEDVIGTAFDPYIFVRDAYFQRQNAAIEMNDLVAEGKLTTQEPDDPLSDMDFTDTSASGPADPFYDPDDPLNNTTF